MTSFIEALKNFDFTAAELAKNVNISLGNGNNTVTVMADDSKIEAGNGNNVVETLGDDDSIILGDGNNKVTTSGLNTKIMTGDINDSASVGNNDIFQVGDNATIVAANGNNHIISYSNNAKILAGDGDNTIGSLGNDVAIGVQNGNNNIAFWGNNDVIDAGNGNNNIKTLDWLIKDLEPGDDISKAHNQEIRNKWQSKGQTLGDMDKDADLLDMANQVKALFTPKTTKTHDLINSTTTSTSRTWTSGQYRYTETTYTTVSDYLDTVINSLKVDGVKNPTVKIGNGNNDIVLTVSDNASVTQKDKSKGNNKITVLKGGYEWYQSVDSEEKTETTKKVVTTRVYIDPLVLDYNQDGKVSSASDMGIDLDGDGIADGAATGGDKMLAMSDVNGNGKIDGAEVFGNYTVDPFTGKKLNAENGFEALAKLAESAEKHTGITCMDDEGNVNLADLQRALATVGINLGFVSDANDSMIEELDKVVSINVKNYVNSGETDNLSHHAQQGYYIADDGKKYKADDISFLKF